MPITIKNLDLATGRHASDQRNRPTLVPRRNVRVQDVGLKGIPKWTSCWRSAQLPPNLG